MTDPTPTGAARGYAADLGDLLDAYDPLLEDAEAPLGEDQLSNLYGLARVFDLDVPEAASPGLVWRQLRDVMVRRLEPGDGRIPAGERRPLCLLVVENDPDVAMSVVDGLRGAGHRVVGPVPDAAQGAALAALHELDVALVDVNLDGAESGIDLARALRGTWGVPTILLTADVTEAARNVTVAAALILKPFAIAEILAVLDRGVEQGLFGTP